jgi:hypothetical protein
MADDPLYHHLREQRWRRPLTPPEQEQLRAWLATHPEAQEDWDAESGLENLLNRVPNVSVPSNFTARVLQAVEREEAVQTRGLSPTWWRLPRLWMPKAAVAALVLGGGLLSYHHLATAHVNRLARSVVAVSDVSSLPSPEILTNYDAILCLNQAPAADEHLLALLK